MVRVNTCGTIAHAMTDTGLKIKSMDMGYMNGLTADATMASGKTTTCMEKVYTLGKTVGDTKESTLMIESMDLVSIHGLTADNMWDNGKMANSTERADIDKLEDRRDKDIGKMAKESSGLKNEQFLITI